MKTHLSFQLSFPVSHEIHASSAGKRDGAWWHLTPGRHTFVQPSSSVVQWIWATIWCHPFLQPPVVKWIWATRWWRLWLEEGKTGLWFLSSLFSPSFFFTFFCFLVERNLFLRCFVYLIYHMELFVGAPPHLRLRKWLHPFETGKRLWFNVQ